MALDTRMQSHTAFKPCTASTGWKVSPALWDAEFAPLLLTLSPTCLSDFLLLSLSSSFSFLSLLLFFFYSFLIFFHFPPSSLSPVFLPSPYQLEDFTVQWKHLSVEQRSTCWTVCWVHCCYKITLNVRRCLREWVGVLVCVILCGCMCVWLPLGGIWRRGNRKCQMCISLTSQKLGSRSDLRGYLPSHDLDVMSGMSGSKVKHWDGIFPKKNMIFLFFLEFM